MPKASKQKTLSPTATGDGKSGSAAPAVDRAIALMELLESRPQHAFSLAEIARGLGIPKSTASNICAAMALGQLARKTQNGYQLGRRLVQLGSAYVSSIDLAREFYEVCRAAPADLGATIQLSVLDEEFNAVYLAYQDCGSGLRLGLSGGVGRVVPANCSASGKALLAALPEAVFEARLSRVPKLPALTPASITSIAKLRKDIAAIRKQGVATDDGGTVPGLSCVAGTVTTSYGDGEIVGISITAAKETLTKKRSERLRGALTQMLKSLQARL